MKYSIIIKTLFISALAINIVSCDSSKKQAENFRMKADSLQTALSERDSAYNTVMDLMVTVETQIEAIKEKEYAIDIDNEKVLDATMEDRIIKDMEAIDKLIVESRNTIRNLSNKLDEADMANLAFKAKVERLNEKLLERTNAILALKQSLASKNARILEMSDELMAKEGELVNKDLAIKKKEEIITEQQTALYTGYFKSASEDQLINQGIVNKEGGFLWLGQTLDIQGDVAKEKFEQLNILEVNELVIESDEIEMITEHPKSSYNVVSLDNQTVIKIIEPEKFWELSKYLVVAEDS